MDPVIPIWQLVWHTPELLIWFILWMSAMFLMFVGLLALRHALRQQSKE